MSPISHSQHLRVNLCNSPQLIVFLSTMGVSCCGQAKHQSGVATNGQPSDFLSAAGPGIIDTQPVYHDQPVLNGLNSGFQPPNAPTTPLTAHHNTFSNGFQHPMREFGGVSPFQQQTLVPTVTGTTYNGQQTPMREYGASPPSQQTALPTYTGTTFNGSNFSSINHSITRPKSSHSPHSPPPQVNAPIQVEGKMSISIDFGVYPHVTSLHSLILAQVQHSLVL
jgi:hypothetical protein